MSESTLITTEDLAQYIKVSEDLEGRIDEYAQLVEEHPLEYTFGNVRVVLGDRDDIVDFIARLKRKINEYNAASLMASYPPPAA